MSSVSTASQAGRTGAPLRFAAELRFIIDLCDADRRPANAAATLDWGLVAKGLDRHGLARLVPQMLAAPGLVPEPTVGSLRAMHMAQAANALARVGETIRVCASLAQADVRFLLIKGLALSVQLYGRPEIRASKDIDLLIEPQAMARADAVLRALGYTRPAEDQAKDQLDYDAKEVGYLNHARGMMVEVHSRLTENAELYDVDFETLWQARETVTLGGRDLPALGREGLATYLCVHGAKHCWARLMWLLDIAALAPSPEAIEALLVDARRHRLEPLMLHTLWLLHHWFGHPIPKEILDRAEASRTARMLTWITIRYHAGPNWHAAPPRHSWRRFFLNSVLGRAAAYVMKPERAYWRQQLAFELISPADRTIVALPPRFAWGYAALRPFGWLIRRLRR